MATISKEAIQWMQDKSESDEEVIAQLEEELTEALEENASLKAQLQLMMADRSVAV